MFTYKLVEVELAQIYMQCDLIKTASHEASMAVKDGKDHICQIKIKDLEQQLKEANKLISQLHSKIEYLKNS
jgi:hypothetical protein